MRAMKDSGIEWIGEIPREWDVVRIKYVLDKSEFGIKIGPFGSTLANRTLSSGEYSVYSQANLIANDFSETNHYIDKETFEDLRTYEAKPGDVCVSMMGTIGKCKEVPCGIREGIMDSHLIKIRLNGSRINPRFFEYVYDKDDSGVCYTQMQYEKKGTIMDGLNTTIVKNLFLTLPPLLVQERIANYLDAKCAEIDALIVAKEKTNALLKERRQSIIYEAVTKGLDPTAPMKDSGVEWIGEIPQDWNIWRMKHLASEPLQYGANATGVEFAPELPRYVRITDITPERKLSAEGKQSLPENVACDYMLRHGDILFARSGATSGKSFYYEESFGRCCFAGYLIRFRPDIIKADGKFLFYYTLTQAYEKWTQQIFIQATIQNISAEKYNNLVFAVPPTLEMQTQIVSYLDEECGKLDKIISENDSTIQKLREYRQSLIYEAVTGKIEV